MIPMTVLEKPRSNVNLIIIFVVIIAEAHVATRLSQNEYIENTHTTF